MITIIGAVIIGYLLGSISPAFFLGKILKGIDIREHGTKSAGATNTKKVLGIYPAVLVTVFDLSKGVLVLWIAFLLGLAAPWAYLAGSFAVVGHIFPFYLKFRGGQGAATSVGLLFYFLIKIILLGSIDWTNIWPSLLALAIFCFTMLYIARIGEFVGTFVLPVLMITLITNLKDSWELWFLLAILSFLFTLQIKNIIVRKFIKLSPYDREQIFNWRTMARPLALLFILFIHLWPVVIVLYIAGTVALIFIAIDLLRLISGRANIFMFKTWRGFLKEKEDKSFSSMTFFMTAVFLLFLLFPPDIASLALIFTVMGDLASKILGLFFSRTKFLTKSVECTLSYFAVSLLFGTIYIQFFPFPVYLLILGSATAALTEPLSIFGIDDNFTVALISAGLMYSITFFV